MTIVEIMARRHRLRELPDGDPGALALIGSADACAALLRRKESRGEATRLDVLLVAVAELAEVREGAKLRELVDLLEAWIEEHGG